MLKKADWHVVEVVRPLNEDPPVREIIKIFRPEKTKLWERVIYREVWVNQFVAMGNWALASGIIHGVAISAGIKAHEFMYEFIEREFPGGLDNFLELFPGE